MTRAKKSSSKSSRLTTKLFIKPKSAKALPKPDPPAFDSLPVSAEQCRKAINALVAHGKKRAIEREATDLLADEDDEALWLNVATKRMSPKDHPKPIRIAVPHPLLDPRKNPVCLLVKDPQREYKDLLESKNVKFISRVVGMEKLQGKFKAFEARRQLMKEHDLFLVDDRIMAEMPRVLGKKWLQAKKSPVPVNLQRADLKGNLERAIASAYLRLNTGNATAIKIGYLSRHSIDELCDNLMAAIPHLAVHMPMGGWDNIQGLSIKLSTSASLPIWQCSLNTAGEKDSSSRFYIADVNEEEFAAKKAAHEAKQQRIKDKKARKLGKKGEDGVKSIEAAPESEDVPEAAEAASSEVATPAKSPQRPSAKADKPSKSDRKTVSSTSKASKGMSTVKGFPQKTKKSKSA